MKKGQLFILIVDISKSPIKTKLSRVVPLRGPRLEELRSKIPKNSWLVYDTSHVLAEEHSSTKNDKNTHNIWRDCSAKSLPRFNSVLNCWMNYL